MVVGLEAIVTLVAEGAVKGIEAQSGGKTGGLKSIIQKRARDQVTFGTAIPIPPSSLAAFEAGGRGVLTGRARQFAFIGPGSTLTIAQRIVLGLIDPPRPLFTLSPGFAIQTRSRSLSLGQLVGRDPGGPSLSDRLKDRDGNT